MNKVARLNQKYVLLLSKFEKQRLRNVKELGCWVKKADACLKDLK